MSDMVFCTLFDSKYLDKGLALWYSLEQTAGEYQLFIFCFDDLSYDVLNKMDLAHVELVSLEQIEDEELLKIKAQRSKGEYCWTCVPVAIGYVLDHYNVSSCAYLDSDVYFFSSPRVLYDEIDAVGCDIVVTEHRFGNSRQARKWRKKSGKYCVEFNYFNQSDNAREALNWWKEKCYEWCYALYQENRMGNQKYLEQFPDLFKGVHELQHLGGGTAPWNLEQYCLAGQGNPLVLEEKKTGKQFEVVFYHFQNIRYLSEKMVNLNSRTHDRVMKKCIYYPYLKLIVLIREQLEKEYGIHFGVKKGVASNKLKAFLQRNVLAFKIKSLSDIVVLEKIN